MTDGTDQQLPTNWGRWGEDDELGTLNLVTAEVRARGVAEAREGEVVPLGRAVTPAPTARGPFGPDGPRSSAVQQALLYTGTPPMGMAETLVLTPHDPSLTHLDAVAHIPVDGMVYPGRPLAECVDPGGVRHGSTAAFGDGVVTKGVLLDLAPGDRLPPAHGITGTDLDAAAERGGVTVLPGDAVVLRGGWTFAWDAEEPTPGLTLDAVAWLHRHDVALLAGDVGDAFPPLEGEMPMPLHLVGLARLGLPLVDGASVEDLAAVCGRLSRSSFMLVVAPPRIHGATGLPVNPLAVF
ncbi:cyclase family protein [Phycicoccus flavus]|uniref:cyclase family protein n=1 Tax=Phycicoccus flavus TaxID=2502783 RepID=UPI000FEBD980|nr:cyclase family protein [Phycicoccus flavus]NHA68126.1 cyclase family protein [Phycicoccus flavus]